MMKAARLSGSSSRLLAGGIATTMMLFASPAGQAESRPASIAVIAHRGGALLRPENTVPALRHAVELGAEVLEFDMMMTADDKMVVHHDADINRDVCKPDPGAKVMPGPIRGLSFAQIRRFDCGSGVRPSYAGKSFVAVPGARIPSLDEVLRGGSDSEARFFAETKIPKGADVDPVKFAMLLDAAVREHGLEDRLILQSFDFRTIDALHAINPRIRTCLLGVPKLTREYLTMLRQHHATCIVLGHADIDKEGVSALRQNGITVFSNVADTAEDWRKYVDLGVDALFTNDPARLIDFLRKSGLRR